MSGALQNKLEMFVIFAQKKGREGGSIGSPGQLPEAAPCWVSPTPDSEPRSAGTLRR